MYDHIRLILLAGYEVSLRPISKEVVKLTVTEAKNGSVKGVEVDMTCFEWGFVETGLTERLGEAMDSLNIKHE